MEYCLKNLTLSKIKILKARINKTQARAEFTDDSEFMKAIILPTFGTQHLKSPLGTAYQTFRG